MEFGAGKGNLSNKIAEENNDKSGHLLLEYSKQRFKHDKNHANNKFYFRFLTNIKDFNVNFIENAFKDFPKIDNKLKIVGVSKHCCGYILFYILLTF